MEGITHQFSSEIFNDNYNIIFIINNPDVPEKACINSSLLSEVAKHIDQMSSNKKLMLVINTYGGNLACGFKIINMLKEKSSSITSFVFDNCGSTGTFMILASNDLYITAGAKITPTEPQMKDPITGEDISISVIRNYLEESSKHEGTVEKLNPITLGTYYSIIKNFRHYCDITFGEKSNNIYNFMINEINSHQRPLIKEELERLGLHVKNYNDNSHITGLPMDCIKKTYDQIMEMFKANTKTNQTITVILSNKGESIYKIDYDKDKKKLFEGFIFKDLKNLMLNSYYTEEFAVENKKGDDDEMANIKQKGELKMEGGAAKRETTSRIEDVLIDISAERKKKGTGENPIAYSDAHWDSYSDSNYHDNYNDRYDDYGDNSYYHDEYRDGFAAPAPEEKPKVYQK